MSSQRLTAKRTRELLALKKVYNDTQLMGAATPFIAFRKRDVRQQATPAWQVLRADHRTDPDGSYRDGFNKTFTLLGDVTTELKNQRLADAQAWASTEYGVTEWVKTPYGSWTSGIALDARLRELLPKYFDSGYRDPIVQQIVDKLHGDDEDPLAERMFRVVITLYTAPEPPLYVKATDADAAHRQVVQLFTRLAGTRVLDGLKLNVYDA